jgi:hypothetical protein
MLSAVELHSGGGAGFYTHPSFGRPPPPPVSSDAVQYPAVMSGTEFARPKPKSIGNSTLNGLSPSAISPPTHKYSHPHLHHAQQQQQQQQHQQREHEQNGPVNLAVNHHHHHQPSRQQASTPEKEHSEKEIDVVGLGGGSSSVGGNPISFSSNGSSQRILSSFPAGLGSSAYQALNYSFYGNRYK